MEATMPSIDLKIRSTNPEITTSLFGADTSAQNAVVDLADDVTLGLKDESVQRGFVGMDTQFLLHIALQFPVSVASSVAARFLYERLAPFLKKGDTVSVGKDAIVVERVDELEPKLTETFDKVRSQSSVVQDV
jgi:hypothetical protein